MLHDPMRGTQLPIPRDARQRGGGGTVTAEAAERAARSPARRYLAAANVTVNAPPTPAGTVSVRAFASKAG